jgi:hypothetical protein
MKADNLQQQLKQPQKRQSPSPMIVNSNGNPTAANYSQQMNYENPTKKFGMQHPLSNSTNSANNSTNLKNPNGSPIINNTPNANANSSNNQKMYHSNNGMVNILISIS